MAWWGVLAMMFLGALHPAMAQDLLPVPRLQSRVNDLSATLSAPQIMALESRLARIEQRKGAQVVILIVPSTQPEAIEQFSMRVAESWKVGRGRPSGAAAGSAPDDGVLIVVALQDRRMRIEVGYGLEGAIPDAIARRIVSEQMAPRFREGDFSGGLMAAVEALGARIEGESLPAPSRETSTSTGSGAGDAGGSASQGDVLAMLMVVGMVGLVISQFMGRLPGALVAAGLGGLGSATMLGSWLWAVPVALGAFTVVLLMGGVRARGRGLRSAGARRGSTPWGIPGGGPWGGGSGGFGGGGFSGGGGGFGGGGASGDW
jgi:uncharacterized protein